MNAQTKIEPAGLDLLRKPFAANQVSKLPKGGVMLDYVGHAALTDRLLDADLNWNWEPLALTQDGLPKFDDLGGLWIKLTICGVTRLGYGDAGGKKGTNAIKEAIGDALRNSGMRFGAALDLWHKGDLHADEEQAGGTQQESEVSPPPAKREPQHSALKAKVRGFVHELNGCGDGDELSAFMATPEAIAVINEVREKLPNWWTGWDEQPDGFTPLADLISRRQRECAETTARYMTA